MLLFGCFFCVFLQAELAVEFEPKLGEGKVAPCIRDRKGPLVELQPPSAAVLELEQELELEQDGAVVEKQRALKKDHKLSEAKSRLAKAKKREELFFN
jgi:hypothetical protein